MAGKSYSFFLHTIREINYTLINVSEHKQGNQLSSKCMANKTNLIYYLYPPERKKEMLAYYIRNSPES